MTETLPVYRIPQGKTKRNDQLRTRLESTYRSQLSAVIETERLLVDLGFMTPEQRRVMSRGEKRQDKDTI